jgi:methyl-accepting chemotaxis protein
LISEQNQRSEELLPSTTSLGQRSNIIEFLDRILDKGIVINGDITVLVAGIELLSLRINLVIASIETAKRYGIELPWEKWQSKQEIEKYNNNKNQIKMKRVNEIGKKLGRQALSKEEKEEKQTGLRLLSKHKQQKGNITKKNQISSSSTELRNGIAKLVLTIVKVLVDLLEKQAQRKVTAGDLTSDEMERLGSAFIDMRQTLRGLITKFGFKYEELDIPIASLGNRAVDTNNSAADEQILSAPMLVDILDKLINKQTVIAGQIVISVADIDLIVLNLLGMLLTPQNWRHEEKTADSFVG